MTQLKNIKPKKDPFDMVPFVENMTIYQLKMTIRDLWKNLQKLASVFDVRRRDVSRACDRIMDGVSWNKNDIRDQYVYANHEEFIIRYDSLNNEITIMDAYWNPTHEKPIKCYSLTEAKQKAKERREQAKKTFMDTRKEIVIK